MKQTDKENNEKGYPLSAKNYILIAIGFGVVVLGFSLMTGSGSQDPAVFDDSIFSFRRITLAPFIVIAGFATVFYAIIKKPRKK
ncbi:hypothetical protein C7377_0490 [Balneicella halophila]|uniref:DUF3098 family protein n=1 Tax=Balneicella halophila TaxID=1537566 RepID=A0A7L4UQZ3_BALHA|nr:DUF3098 domain-containing protein [Balneicella halophila]PVX52186.1 hypothetical protein C7377_0490 [Balneicella halophila]